VAAGYTSSGSWGVGAAQSTRLRGDRMRIDGFLGYVDLRYRFFGVGSSAGSAGVSVPIVQKGYAFVPELLFQVARNSFLGARLRAVRVETALDGSPPAIVERSRARQFSSPAAASARWRCSTPATTR
jgi:hypothetical protein